MNSYKAVKLLYSVTFSIFIYIVWAVVSNILVQLQPDSRVFLLGLGILCLKHFLSVKYSQKSVVLLIPSVIAMVIIYFMFGPSDDLVNIIFVVLNLFLLAREDRESIEYRYYRDKIMIRIYVLLGMGVLLIPISQDVRNFILRFYLLFLVSSIILLRESRRHRYNIKTKNSTAADISIIVGIVLLSLDGVYNMINKVFAVMWTGISYVMGVIIVALVWILEKPSNYIENLIRRKFGGIQRVQIEEADTGDPLEALRKMAEGRDTGPSSVTIFIFRLLIVLVILYIVYRIYKKYSWEKISNQEGVQERREKIAKENTGKKNPLIEALKGLFAEKDLKSQILKVYQSFQKRAYDRDIFKRHMTATQLYNVSKAFIEESEPVKSITEIYNEAKFSEHPLSEDALRKAKESYSEVKKQLEEKEKR
jgi:hypothetical protein